MASGKVERASAASKKRADPSLADLLAEFHDTNFAVASTSPCRADQLFGLVEPFEALGVEPYRTPKACRSAEPNRQRRGTGQSILRVSSILPGAVGQPFVLLAAAVGVVLVGINSTTRR
jgi:hypothetical protein